jgi:hypothetical protein
MSNENPTDIPLQPGDFYMENGNMVFTAQYLLKQGCCCGNNCRHCPYGNSDEDRAKLNKP